MPYSLDLSAANLCSGHPRASGDPVLTESKRRAMSPPFLFCGRFPPSSRGARRSPKGEGGRLEGRGWPWCCPLDFFCLVLTAQLARLRLLDGYQSVVRARLVLRSTTFATRLLSAFTRASWLFLGEYDNNLVPIVSRAV